MGETVEVRTTLASRDEASRLAREAVAARLAACGTVSGPVTSHYRWQGSIESAEEWTCSFKTTRARWPELATFLRERHPYELPEILVLTASGSREYLAWLGESTA